MLALCPKQFGHQAQSPSIWANTAVTFSESKSQADERYQGRLQGPQTELSKFTTGSNDFLDFKKN